ncbi:hypothetical protein KIN20_018304 [Parelaphostrongylus tenuis]|uniref:Uncharacterized protein n=1 Tax=Parelaphostrongylus tenuis TaxID=148309 RepID=A0AAD5MJQ1_PARTN|nr:hypothetical protein KIN20_018304 [Parelaphostrongylus tenuis]
MMLLILRKRFHYNQGQTAESLVVAVERSVQQFLDQGDAAIRSCPMAHGTALETLTDALVDVRDTGQSMFYAGRDFIRTVRHHNAEHLRFMLGKTLLQAVAHFLILADSVDVDLIIEGIDKSRSKLTDMNFLTSEIEEVEEVVRRRVADLRDPNQRDDTS